MSEVIQAGKYVELTYKVTDRKTGHVLTRVEFPLGYVHGHNEILAPAVHMRLEGKAAGDVIEHRALTIPCVAQPIELPNLTPGYYRARLTAASAGSEVVERRLCQAREEIGAWRDFDYAVVSGTMEEDLRRVRHERGQRGGEGGQRNRRGN